MTLKPERTELRNYYCSKCLKYMGTPPKAIKQLNLDRLCKECSKPPAAGTGGKNRRME